MPATAPQRPRSILCELPPLTARQYGTSQRMRALPEPV